MDFQEGSGGMKYDLFSFTGSRRVLLCGTNYYPTPEYHGDRVLEEHDLMYILEGSWQLAQDNDIYNLKAGDVILLRAGSHHWGTAPCTVGSRNMFIHFSREKEDRLKAELTGAEARLFATGNTFCVGTLTHCGLENEMNDLFRNVVQVYWGHRDDRNRLLNILLNEILNELSSIARNSAPQAEDWIMDLLSVLNRNPDRLYSLGEAAEIAGMSERVFSARFRKMMGKSFHEYQADRKLNLAYEALRTGRYTVREAAAEYGFNDPFYFSRLFRRKFGVTPSEIRKGEPSVNVNRPWMR